MIADWSELMLEASKRVADPTILQRAGMITGFAEGELNKKLRTAEMEASATLTLDSAGEADLPTGYVTMRTARQGTYRLPEWPLVDIREGVNGYAIVGGKIIGCAGVEIEIDYYTEIPGLEANGTNWLLASDPEIYLFAVIKHALLAAMDMETAGGAAGYLERLLAEKSGQDADARFGETRMTIAGANP